MFQVYSVPIGGMCVRQPVSIGGSGSTYVYGYVDATFKEKMTKEACMEFCTNSKFFYFHLICILEKPLKGLILTLNSLFFVNVHLINFCDFFNDPKYLIELMGRLMTFNLGINIFIN